MNAASFINLTNFVGSERIGLGWLSGISVQANERAVTTDWHRHRTMEMIFCLHGEIRYEFRKRPAVLLHAGSYILIPANTEHRVLDAIDSPGRRLGLNLKRGMDAHRKFGIFSAADYSYIHAQLVPLAFRVMSVNAEMKNTLSSLERLTRKHTLSSIECSYIRILCCSLLYQAILPSGEQAVPVVRLMDSAVDWLRQHLAERVSIERLVAYMGYSKSHLFMLFRKHTGSSPNGYLQRLRIEKAKDLLIHTKDTSRSIAIACGFQSNGYFTRIFRRQTGLTPLAYRRKF